MFLAAACALILGQGYEFKAWAGVWEGSDGNPYVINQKNQITFRTIDLEAGGEIEKLLEAGSYYGHWIKSKNASMGETPGFVDWTLGPRPEAWVGNPYGEIWVTPGIPDSDGTIRTLKFQAGNSRHFPEITDRLRLVGPNSLIDISGSFKSKEADIQIDSNDHDFRGRGKAIGTKFLFSGHRYANRAILVFLDPNTEHRVGTGWIDWYPTRECLEGMRSDGRPTDQLLVHFFFGGAVYPTGSTQVMKRAE